MNWVVVDLGFGDAGKGAIVDFLAREARAPATVVRFGGGGQAGHRVVTDDGRQHVFSQVGAGTFVPGATTLLGPEMVLHPTALLVELQRLVAGGVDDAPSRLAIDARVLVTTPFHQAANRLRELARGPAAHGTVGVGVGETVAFAARFGADALRAADLDSAELAPRAEGVRQRLEAELAHLVPPESGGRRAVERFEAERAVLADPELAARWASAVRRERWPLVDGDRALADAFARGPVIFEGAQGVLLDRVHGFFPHVTHGRCGPAPVREWLARIGQGTEVPVLGVLRTYMTRHGAGPLPSETRALEGLPEPTNDDAGWQGAFRRGWLDPLLLRYAIGAIGGVDGLALNHLDAAQATEEWKRVESRPGPVALEARTAAALAAVECEQRSLPRAEEPLIEVVEALLESPVRLASRGPSAAAKRWR